MAYASPFRSSTPSLHAVEDQAEEDKGVVAVVGVHVLHHPLTQLAKVAGLGELALVHEAGPRANGHPPLLQPLLDHAGRDALRQPDPGRGRRQPHLHLSVLYEIDFLLGRGNRTL